MKTNIIIYNTTKRIIHVKWAIDVKYVKYIMLPLPLSQKCHIFKSCIDVIFSLKLGRKELYPILHCLLKKKCLKLDFIIDIAMK